MRTEDSLDFSIKACFEQAKSWFHKNYGRFLLVLFRGLWLLARELIPWRADGRNRGLADATGNELFPITNYQLSWQKD
ncbi:MAG: hypothetical protein EAZ60_10120 [Oscillatoriales cyanobacterium]|nr:MAG: hypothetical protein EAZ83_27455 [Oscillatoriales cyanobacterium]TAE94839.1 MAG: hypothetical protein EAZ79_21540 [Oscillatoriales cyanobacterium]TAF16328.1 MAG: hypothetical protein EAZ73_24840 [Oscillatoriales cyanobacterium]TAF33239.1 MAG: hypothetical protein EAZ69_16580 [Oscillatoriales cyanobacterium]TAF56283.1 MAG: hypothetical protein EAZ60_10120 [Oscillatoriales cyanobacterium]